MKRWMWIDFLILTAVVPIANTTASYAKTYNIQAVVDHDSELVITPKGFFWRNIVAGCAKPGYYGNNYEKAGPTYVNNIAWVPTWNTSGSRDVGVSSYFVTNPSEYTNWSLSSVYEGFFDLYPQDWGATNLLTSVSNPLKLNRGIVESSTYNGYPSVRIKDYYNGQNVYSFTITVNDGDPGYTISTVSAKGTQNGWVLESTEISSRGGTLDVRGTTLRVGDDAANKQYRTVLSFNTESLPDNAVIVSAKLKVRYQGRVGANPFTTHGNIILDAKLGSFSNNTALQIGDFQAVPTRAAAATILNAPVAGWYSAAIAPGYINKWGYSQFRLRFAKDDDNDRRADYLSFYSGNAAAALRPVLEVVYYVP